MSRKAFKLGVLGLLDFLKKFVTNCTLLILHSSSRLLFMRRGTNKFYICLKITFNVHCHHNNSVVIVTFSDPTVGFTSFWRSRVALNPELGGVRDIIIR